MTRPKTGVERAEMSYSRMVAGAVIKPRKTGREKRIHAPRRSWRMTYSTGQVFRTPTGWTHAYSPQDFPDVGCCRAAGRPGCTGRPAAGCRRAHAAGDPGRG